MKRIFLVFMFLSILSLNSFAQEGNLQATLKAAKEVFKQGEEINIKLTIQNSSDQPVTIVTPEYSNVSVIEIKNAEGGFVIPQPYTGSRAYFQKMATIPAGGSKDFVYFNLTWYESGSAKTFQASEAKLPAGEYEIQVTITNPPRESTIDLGNTWQGSLTSNPVKIKIE